MARKQTSKQATAEDAAADNGQTKASPSKKDAVREALEMGISSDNEDAGEATGGDSRGH